MKTNEEYQGWTNSATWSCAYLINQEKQAYDVLTGIRKQGKQVTGKDVKEQFTRLNLKRDAWTKGVVNWQEIADTHYNQNDY